MPFLSCGQKNLSESVYKVLSRPRCLANPLEWASAIIASLRGPWGIHSKLPLERKSFKIWESLGGVWDWDWSQMFLNSWSKYNNLGNAQKL